MLEFKLVFDGFWVDDVSLLPATSGVYIVYKCVHDTIAKTVSLTELVYIGESEDIEARVSNHECEPYWTRRLKAGEKLCYAYAPVSPLNRERIEAALIYKHKPSVNIEYRDNFPFDVTRVVSDGTVGLLTTDFTVSSSNKSPYQNW